MGIAVNRAGDTFHLYNQEISYIMTYSDTGGLFLFSGDFFTSHVLLCV